MPPELRWADDDPLATHINDARLRAKYYGAKYIIHRPFLRYALDHEIVFDSDTQGAVSQAMDRKNSVMLPPHTAAQTQKSEIFESCKECVHAAMQSTVAFDHIIQKRRLIVTNIFGTAHAYVLNISHSLAMTARSLIICQAIWQCCCISDDPHGKVPDALKSCSVPTFGGAFRTYNLIPTQPRPTFGHSRERCSNTGRASTTGL